MTFNDVSQCFTSVSCFTMFNNILRCLVSHAMIGIVTSATANHFRDSNNAAGIGDNAAEIDDDTPGIVDITGKVIQC